MEKDNQGVLNISRLLDVRDRYNLNPKDIAGHFHMLQREEEAGVGEPSSEPGPELLQTRLNPLTADPEFAEVMRRIDSTRDAEGVPRDAQEEVEDLIALCIRYMTEESLYPPVEELLDWMSTSLIISGMTAVAKERVSTLITGIYEEIDAHAKRVDRNRAKRERRNRRR